jgi:hypothetical protein
MSAAADECKCCLTPATTCMLPAPKADANKLALHTDNHCKTRTPAGCCKCTATEG